MASFLSSASRQVVDVRTFLRDSAGGNSLKYAAVSGEKHQIYIPFVTTEVLDENGNTVPQQSMVAISGNVHEWNDPSGKYKSTVCMKDVIRQSDDGSTLLNDGSCAFCERVSDAWDVYRYRMSMEEERCTLTGDERKKHLEKSKSAFADELKAKAAKPYMYILIVKFRTDNQGKPNLGDDGLPEYDLKVMKLSASRVERITQQLENAGTPLVGSEIIFGYPKTDDKRLVVGQSTTSPVFPNSKFTVKYPALLNKINADVAKFKWDGIEKSFGEWSGMTSAEAKAAADALFESWDAYKLEVKTNPNAKYLEYVAATPNVNQPDVSGAVMPNVPQIPGAVGAPTMPQMPNMPNMSAPVMPNVPNMPTMDVNSAFGGTQMPTI